LQIYASDWVVRDSLSFNGIDNVAVAVQRQRVIHTENSGFASPTLGQHISTFRGYRILFSINFLIYLIVQTSAIKFLIVN
jgi:hypothetical protein